MHVAKKSYWYGATGVTGVDNQSSKIGASGGSALLNNNLS